MKLARLPFLVLAAAALVSCSSDATGVGDDLQRTRVRVPSPTGPLFSGATLLGSGGKTSSDSTSTSSSSDSTFVAQ